MSKQVDHAKDQARLQYESIAEMITAYKQAENNDNNGAREEARERIQEGPLSVEVRSGWHTPGINDVPAEEYNILLCTGGPAVRIIGTLGEHLEPESARIQYQDWGTPWTDYPLTSEQETVVLEYAQHFYYGE